MVFKNKNALDGAIRQGNCRCPCFSGNLSNGAGISSTVLSVSTAPLNESPLVLATCCFFADFENYFLLFALCLRIVTN
jgi:hypothetical protein